MSKHACCPRSGGPYGARRSAGRSFTPVSRRAGSEEGQMSNVWRRFWEDESGQSLIEYVLIIALVALVVVGVLVTIGEQMRNRFNDISECLDNPTLPECGDPEAEP